MMFIFSKIKGWMIGAVAALGILYYVFSMGRSKERERQAAEEAQDYIDTRRKIDEAIADQPDDWRAARERMLNRIRERRER
jgi:hypothetical protein